VDGGPDLLLFQELEPGEPEPLRRLDLGSEDLVLERAVGNREQTVGLEIGIDLLGLADAADHLDRLLRGEVEGLRLLGAHGRDQLLEAAVNQRHGKAAVAPRSAVPDGAALDHDHGHAGIVLQQVVGRPEAAEAGTDDHDVGPHLPLEGGVGLVGVESQPVAPGREFHRHPRTPRDRSEALSPGRAAPRRGP
jgi:hypothetical protein